MHEKRKISVQVVKLREQHRCSNQVVNEQRISVQSGARTANECSVVHETANDCSVVHEQRMSVQVVHEQRKSVSDGARTANECSSGARTAK
jgi:hypothetical protein